MNLILDFGNTRIKVGIFSGEEFISQEYFSEAQDLIKHIKDRTLPVKNCLLSSVTPQHYAFLQEFSSQFPIKLFSSELKLPLKLNYKSPETLGSDRLACGLGAKILFPEQNVLIIDAGTCVKYDFVSNDGYFEGGGIAPGLNMRYKALQYFTAKLPLVAPEANYHLLTGKSTEESIKTGVQTGLILEANGFIEQYLLKDPDLKIILTGGDGPYLAGHLKNSIFAEPNLALIGLNAALLYNE